jgi:enoyl-CoA hydratase
MAYETILYDVDGAVARITLNRPERLNTIVPPMPDEFRAAIDEAALAAAVKVIVVRGAGRAFCAGYDFSEGFHHWDAFVTTDGDGTPARTP